MGSKKSDILYLFDRPAEPVYVPKGENQVAFEVPDNYFVSSILDSLIAYQYWIPRYQFDATLQFIELEISRSYLLKLSRNGNGHNARRSENE